MRDADTSSYTDTNRNGYSYCYRDSNSYTYSYCDVYTKTNADCEITPHTAAAPLREPQLIIGVWVW
jgi:hypothetical protein